MRPSPTGATPLVFDRSIGASVSFLQPFAPIRALISLARALEGLPYSSQ